MNSINKSKALVSFVLSIAILFTFSLSATDTNDTMLSDAQHKQIIQQFLSEITFLQRQVFDIAQSALRDPSPDDRQLEIRINLINNNIERLNAVIQEYLATVPGVSARNRHVLLTFNVLNLVKSSLYTLSLLIRTTTDAERIALLDEFFNARVTALDTLAILEDLLNRF